MNYSYIFNIYQCIKAKRVRRSKMNKKSRVISIFFSNKLVFEKEPEKEADGLKNYNVFDAHDLEPLQPLIRKKAKSENFAAKRNSENAKNNEITNYIKCPLPKINIEKVSGNLYYSNSIRYFRTFFTRHQRSRLSFQKRFGTSSPKDRRN